MINYWHIQLHPDNRLSQKTIKDIITTKKVIGLGGYWENKNNQEVPDPTYFQRDMNIGDVVMVRDGSIPVALVEIIGNHYFESNTTENFDWFDLRRDVKLLGFFEDSDKEILQRILSENGKNHIQAPGTLTFCSGKNATNDFIKEWHKAINYRKLMENINLSTERQSQLLEMWEKFKVETKDDDKKSNVKEIEKLTSEWELYKDRILKGTLTVDEYTNVLGSATAILPGGYLCNFLERETKIVLGSSKPGTAENFGVKLNGDGTYYIKSLKKEKANREEAENYFNENIKGLLKNIVQEKDVLAKIELVNNAKYSAKQILMKMAVLDNLEDFIYIYSTQLLDELYSDFIDGDLDDIFSKNHQICLVAKNILKVNYEDKNEIIMLSRFLWKYVNAKSFADYANPNVIIYGSPGTGKTYSVLNNLDFICQGDSSRYEMLQFHPSFTYEDFIEGIKPKGVSENGNIRFELVNGVFKNFCIKAKNDPEKMYYFIVDEINRANLSSVFGETLSLLERHYRHDPENNKNLLKTQYSGLIKDLIKENIDNKSLAYTIDNDEVKFGVPKNIFFIGMMNDVDKSIDAFDIALRRRFKWIQKFCDYEVIEENTLFKNKDKFENISNYIKACEKLNSYISTKLGLGKSFEFGHSFFMKMSEIAKRKIITANNLETLFNLYLHPTLKEYFRAVFAESELDVKLSEALNRFKENLE